MQVQWSQNWISMNLFDALSADGGAPPPCSAVLCCEASLIDETLFINSLCHLSLFTLNNDRDSASWDEADVYKDEVKREDLKSVDGARIPSPSFALNP